MTIMVDATAWLCEVCGEYDNNREDWNRCIQCNTLRGTWLCERCGRKNRKKDTSCRSCGGPKVWEAHEPGG